MLEVAWEGVQQPVPTPEALADEKASTAIAFLGRALAFYAATRSPSSE